MHVSFALIGFIQDFFSDQGTFYTVSVLILNPAGYFVLLGQFFHIKGVAVFHLETQHRSIMKGFFDGVPVETIAVLFLGSLGQVSGTILGIFFKNRGSGEPVPQRPGEVLIQLVLGRRRYCPVTFIHHKNQLQVMELFVLVGSFRMLLHYFLELLDGGDNYISVFGLEFFHQIPGIVRFVHFDSVVLCIGLKSPVVWLSRSFRSTTKMTLSTLGIWVR